MIPRRAVVASAPGLCLALTACGADPPTSRTSQPPPATSVAASFTILADLVREVAGDAVGSGALAGVNRDSHHFDPPPSQMMALSRAQIAVRLGLGFDPWFDRALQATGFSGPVIDAGGTVPVRIGSEATPDPHVWQSIRNCLAMAQTIARGLLAVIPDKLAATVPARLADLEARLTQARSASQAQLASIAPQRRVAVVPHGSFAYLGQELGVRFIALSQLTPGGQLSAKALSRLVQQIRASGAGVAFTENVADSRLMEEVAQMAAIPLGGQLISDALTGPDGPASTLERLIAHNGSVLATGFTLPG